MREAGRESESICFHPMAHSPDCHSVQELCQADGSFPLGLPCGCGAPSSWPASVAFSGTLGESWIKGGAVG